METSRDSISTLKLAKYDRVSLDDRPVFRLERVVISARTRTKVRVRVPEYGEVRGTRTKSTRTFEHSGAGTGYGILHPVLGTGGRIVVLSRILASYVSKN